MAIKDDGKPAGASLPPPPPPRKAGSAPAPFTEVKTEVDIDDRENIPTAKAAKHAASRRVEAPAPEDDPFEDAVATMVDGSGAPGAARFEDEIPTKAGTDQPAMAVRGAVTAADRTTFDPIPSFAKTTWAPPAAPRAKPPAPAAMEPADLFPESSLLPEIDPEIDRTRVNSLASTRQPPAALDLSRLSASRGHPHRGEGPLGESDSTGVDPLPAGVVADNAPVALPAAAPAANSGGGQRKALLGSLARRRFTLSGAGLGLLMAGSGILGALLARNPAPAPAPVAPPAPLPRAVNAPVVQPIEEIPVPTPAPPTITAEAPNAAADAGVTAEVAAEAPVVAAPLPVAKPKAKAKAKPVRRRSAPAKRKARR